MIHVSAQVLFASHFEGKKKKKACQGSVDAVSSIVFPSCVQEPESG